MMKALLRLATCPYSWATGRNTTIVPLALSLPMKSHYGVVESAKQLLLGLLQLGLERFQYISLN